jgi:DNA-binding MarR family transcriptional regulator
MNQDINLSRDQRGAAVDLLMKTLREAQIASDLLDQAFAEFIGINRTDLRCLEIVEHHGQITSGDLARETALTTGAVTAVVDRLETAGLLRRAYDPKDRRKVLVELTPAAKRLAEDVFGPLGRSGQMELDDLTDSEVLTIIGFLEVTKRLTTQHVEAIRGRTPKRTVPLRYRLEQARTIKNEAKALLKTLKQDMKDLTGVIVVDLHGSKWVQDDKGRWVQRSE